MSVVIVASTVWSTLVVGYDNAVDRGCKASRCSLMVKDR